jgi:hypothetical protein
VPLIALALLLLLPLAIIALMPLLLVVRYRAGSARRAARPFLATVNLGVMLVSALFFLTGAAVTSIWVPRAFTAAAAGIGVGLTLGLAGLWLTRWEATPRSLHYTPNRWLVLAVTLVVAVRVVYGFWRGWQAWQTSGGQESFVAAFGIAGSLGAGGVVIGYYLAYAAGLRRRIGHWQRRALRVLS